MAQLRRYDTKKYADKHRIESLNKVSTEPTELDYYEAKCENLCIDMEKCNCMIQLDKIRIERDRIVVKINQLQYPKTFYIGIEEHHILN